MGKMGFRDSKCFLTSTAVITRALFVIYDIVLIWSVYHSKDNEPLWWLFIFSVVPLVAEMVIVIVYNGGSEWNSMFCPSFFIFLVCVTPQLWLIELNHIERITTNITANSSITFSAQIIGQDYKVVTFSYDLLVIGLKECLMYLLILARWVLPIQHLTYQELSDTLLFYIGMAADLMELMDYSNNTTAMKDSKFVYALLIIWTVSLFQFSFVLTPADDKEREEHQISCRFIAEHAEVLSIVLQLIMMHIPFATIRIVAMVLYKGVSYSSVFFMVKSLAMILLSINRLLALFCKLRPWKKKKPVKTAKAVVETEEDYAVTPGTEAAVELEIEPGKTGIDNVNFEIENEA